MAVPPTPSFPLMRMPGIGSFGLGFGGGWVGIRWVPGRGVGGRSPACGWTGIRWVDGRGAAEGAPVLIPRIFLAPVR